MTTDAIEKAKSLLRILSMSYHATKHLEEYEVFEKALAMYEQSLRPADTNGKDLWICERKVHTPEHDGATGYYTYTPIEQLRPAETEALGAFKRVMDDYNHGIPKNRSIQDNERDIKIVEATLLSKQRPTDARKQEALDAFEWLFTNYVPKDVPLVATGYCNVVRAALRADDWQPIETYDYENFPEVWLAGWYEPSEYAKENGAKAKWDIALGRCWHVNTKKFTGVLGGSPKYWMPTNKPQPPKGE